MSNIALKNANIITSNFWIDTTYNIIYGLQPSSRDINTNFEYPIQLIVNSYNPGYSYFADMYQQLGGINNAGLLVINSMRGILNENQSEIHWENGNIWVKSPPPPVRKSDQNNPMMYYKSDIESSRTLSKQLCKAYNYNYNAPK
jgi:hypothetical protein